MRALVISDSRFVAESIQRTLRTEGGINVIGYVDGRNPCYDATVEAQPDAVVLDEMTLAGLALARVREVRAAVPTAKLVVLTGQMQEPWLTEMVEAGVHAAISKSLHPLGIGMLIREICSGTVYHAFAHARREAPAAPTHGALTRRELEILRLATEGTSNGEIAGRLWVTEQTVKFHLSNVFRKLGVANRTQASHYAHVHRLFEPAAAPSQPLPVPEAA
jgi:DNA-binding NarL/FixJ family response regulator